MSEQLPAVVQSGALAVSADTYIVPAIVAILGDQASWRYVEFFAANIRNANTPSCLCAGVQSVFRLVRRSRPDTHNHPAIRRGRMDRAAAGEPRGGRREAAARRRADDVQLAHHRPDRAGEPGRLSVGRSSSSKPARHRFLTGKNGTNSSTAFRPRLFAICATAH